MFRTNPDGMRMEPTPERVLSVCRLIAQNSMTREEVRREMSLGSTDDKQSDEIDRSIKVSLEELAILTTQDNRLVLAVDPAVVSTVTTFRRYVSARVFMKKDTTFYLFTKWLISQNDRIFTLKSWEGMAKACASEIKELSALQENAILGWRFWAAFLGLGYLSGTMIIPNMKLRLQDVLATSFSRNFKYNEAIQANEFITWLSDMVPEVHLSGKLPLALSAALRTLHELELIKLETWRDANRVHLFNVDGDPINDFSHITVKEAVAE